MATINVSALLARAATLLQDATSIRWPQSELLDWLNDAQREIALLKPNAFTKNVSVALSAGTKQALPVDGISLIDVPRNMGANGTTPGNAIRMVSREILDSQVPDWHTAAKQNAVVKHFVYSPLDPRTFYVYPPSTGGVSVEVIYVAAPTDAASNGVITLDDIYATPILDYMLFRAYSKDAEFASNPQVATVYYDRFKGLLSGKLAAEQGSNPNQTLAPGNVNTVGGK